MKLAKIEHVRCREPEGYTIVLVPDDWDEPRFETAVSEAKIAYEAVLNEQRDEEPPEGALAYGPNVNDFNNADPSRTIGELKAEFARRRKLYADWDADRKKAARGFSHYLRERGMSMLWEHEYELEDSVDWGHRHGQRIEYDATV